MYTNDTACRANVQAAGLIWLNADVTPVEERAITRKRRHLFETRDRDLQVVQALEEKLEIEKRWEPEYAEWDTAAAMVAIRRYQRSLDLLEGLVVARMFELTKMNMSQTGKPNSSPFARTAAHILMHRIQATHAHCKGATSSLQGHSYGP